MSKLTDDLRRLGIFNNFGFCYESGIANANYPLDRPVPPVIEGVPTPVPVIAYIPAETGRGYKSACWQVSRLGYKTDPNAHWRDNGRKTFTVHGRSEKEPQRLAVLAWATERYGVSEWAKTPYGAYAPAEFVKVRLAQLKVFIKENS